MRIVDVERSGEYTVVTVCKNQRWWWPFGRTSARYLVRNPNFALEWFDMETGIETSFGLALRLKGLFMVHQIHERQIADALAEDEPKLRAVAGGRK